MNRKIREYAKAVGFEVIGKLTHAGKWDLSSRYYIDENQNVFVVDTVIGGVRIIPRKRKEGKA